MGANDARVPPSDRRALLPSGRPCDAVDRADKVMGIKNWKLGMIGAAIVPLGTDHHAWLRTNCWAAWFKRRKAEAGADLARLGIAR